MEDTGRAKPYEHDATLPEYDNEILYNELANNVRKKSVEEIRRHVISTNNLIHMEELPAFLQIKYCIVVAALLSSEDWELAQTVQCVAEALWRTMFEHACDNGYDEAYLALSIWRYYLNRLEKMRIKSGVDFYKLHDDSVRMDGIYDFEEGDEPPEYSCEDNDAPPAYDELYGSLVRTVRRSRYAFEEEEDTTDQPAVLKRKRADSMDPAVSSQSRVLRSVKRRNAQI